MVSYVRYMSSPLSVPRFIGYSEVFHELSGGRLKRNTENHSGTLSHITLNLQFEITVIPEFETLFDIFNSIPPDSLTGILSRLLLPDIVNLVLAHADSRILYLKPDLSLIQTSGYRQITGGADIFKPVNNGIFHKWLQDQLGNIYRLHLVCHIDFIVKPPGKTHLLYL